MDHVASVATGDRMMPGEARGSRTELVTCGVCISEFNAPRGDKCVGGGGESRGTGTGSGSGGDTRRGG